MRKRPTRLGNHRALSEFIRVCVYQHFLVVLCSRIFVKIVFQQLAEFMGLVRLNERLRDPLLADGFEGLLPRDNPKNTRFAINFFTSIGLGGLT